MHELGLCRQRRRRAHVLASAAPFLIAAVLGGCTPGSSDSASTTTVSVSSTVVESGGGTVTTYSIDALGLQFDLPQNYVAVDDDELLFLARSTEPRSIFSIEPDDPGVSHDPEDGESVSELQLGDVKAQVVTNAVIDGLPPGIAANELLVDNGFQSFSVIVSASPSDLADMWDPFLASLQVEPA
jgi:hypothetical protein